MAHDSQLVFRVSAQLTDALKAYAVQLAVEMKEPVTTAAAARQLLTEALEAKGHLVARTPPAKRGRPPKKAAKKKAAKRRESTKNVD